MRSISSSLGVLCGWAWLTCAAAQPTQPQRVPGSLEARLAPCIACHGSASAPPAALKPGSERQYFPRIAGKPAGYLYNQLINFRDGRRQYPLMTWMVQHLSDDYLHEIADYFSAQHLPAPVLDRAALPAAELERGRQLVLHGDKALNVPACIACHGERLGGALPAIPGLVGLPRDYINAQFGAWRNGSRHALAPDCMGTIASRLSLADVSAVSAWLASEPLPAGAAPAQAVARPLPLACGSAPEQRP
ncbi:MULTISPECIES: cytochrome C [unclassified Massilia]|uniref:c-type cytochrome n=1 Tax=unclassified Massilia TaxID=2609279 RepID=UPI0009E9C296|nr:MULTISPECIES: cytochrome C [unclassified Massilia]